MTLVGSEKFIGKRVLIGITYHDHQEKFLEQKQYYGVIERINQTEGVVVRLNNTDEEFFLPPQLESLEEAKPGEYRLRSTGEVVVDPDFLTKWTRTKAPPDDDAT